MAIATESILIEVKSEKDEEVTMHFNVYLVLKMKLYIAGLRWYYLHNQKKVQNHENNQ
jgi:hypothetical protein